MITALEIAATWTQQQQYLDKGAPVHKTTKVSEVPRRNRKTKKTSEKAETKQQGGN